MRESVKYWLAAGVLGIGLATAMLFRREEQQPVVQAPYREELLILRGDLGHVPRRRPPVSVPLAESAEMAPVQASVAGPTPSPPQQPPPALSAAYEPSLFPIHEGLSPARMRESARRTHKIVDGDTLTGLAERYLGDRGRYLEIYEANAQRLSAPDVLPIGLELTIPSRAQERAGEKTPRASDAAPRASQVQASQPPLVPIPRSTAGE